MMVCTCHMDSDDDLLSACIKLNVLSYMYNTHIMTILFSASQAGKGTTFVSLTHSETETLH